MDGNIHQNCSHKKPKVKIINRINHGIKSMKHERLELTLGHNHMKKLVKMFDFARNATKIAKNQNLKKKLKPFDTVATGSPG